MKIEDCVCISKTAEPLECCGQAQLSPVSRISDFGKHHANTIRGNGLDHRFGHLFLSPGGAAEISR
ncbi:MAG: hypothetical protein ACKV2V_10505, partial [Blastocatellia bacterium]